MKNYDELTNDLLERRDRYVADQKKKRKKVMGIATSLCCFCLVALLGFGMWQGGMFDAKPPVTLEDSINIGDKDYINPDELDNNLASTPDNNDSKTLFVINEITETISAAPKYRDPALHYNEKWNISEMAIYLGVDLKDILVAFNERNEMQYVGLDEFTTTYENNGVLVEDRSAYESEGKDGKRVVILASKLGMPYDCIYQTETDLKTSARTSGTNETVSLRVYAQTKTGPYMEYQMYVIDFEYQGVYFRITAENISPFQLDALICEIIK